MRVTDSLTTNNLMNNIETSLNNYTKVQQEISTGKSMNHISDNPAGGAQSLSMRASLVDNAQYQTNANSATAFLSTGDSAMSSASNLLLSAQQIATQGANGTQNAQDLKSLGAQVDAIIQQLTQVANTDLHGKYVFGGTETQAPPFAAPTAGADPTPTYVGNSQTVTAIIGKNNSLNISTPGSAAFGDAFAALQSLRTDLASGDQTAISADIGKVSTSEDTLTSVRATMGATMNQVTDTLTRLNRSQTDYDTAVSNIEDVDLAQAYVQLQSTQNVYQASLLTTSQSFQLSLANYLK